MSPPTPRVLLLRRQAAPGLAERLREWGCECQQAESYEEARRLLRALQFDVVLSETHLADGSAYRLIPVVRGKQSSLFFALSVEDACLWLPAVVKGEERWGAPALWPKDFNSLLRELLGVPAPQLEPQRADQNASRAKTARAGSTVVPSK